MHCRERAEEHAADDVLPRRRIAIDVGGIGCAVERADLILIRALARSP
jgi:hypothetical protein